MVTAVIEVGAGLALLVAPALVITLLFSPSEIQTAVAIARLVGRGPALAGCGVLVGAPRRRQRASRPLVSGLLIYNAAVVALVLAGNFDSVGPPLPMGPRPRAWSDGFLLRVAVEGQPVIVRV